MTYYKKDDGWRSFAWFDEHYEEVWSSGDFHVLYPREVYPTSVMYLACGDLILAELPLRHDIIIGHFGGSYGAWMESVRTSHLLKAERMRKRAAEALADAAQIESVWKQ